MDALISLVYTIIDSVCVCLFLDAFASHRWRDHRFLVGVIVQTILMYASIEFSVIVLNRNQMYLRSICKKNENKFNPEMAWSLSCFNSKKHYAIFLCW